MLNVLRESFKKGPVLKLVLVAVGLGMVAYLGNYFVDGGSAGPQSWAARVNGTEISALQLRDHARMVDAFMRRMYGQNFAQFRATLEIGKTAVDDLIEAEVIKQDARRMGLRLRDNNGDVVEHVRTSPEFQDASGAFVGREQFKTLVQARYQTTVPQYLDSLSDDLLRARWRDVVTQAVSVTDAEVEAAYRLTAVKTSIKYALLGPADFVVNESVSDEALERWYREHPDSYRRGEARRIRVAFIDRDAQLDGVEVTEERVAEYYKANPDSYRHPEQRSVRHILFRVEEGSTDAERQAARAKAETALQRIRDGEDFATLARDLSEDPLSAANGGDVGFFARGSMVESFETAAFDTSVGELAALTETNYGYHVIEVTGERQAGLTPLADVTAEIRQRLEVEAAQERTQAEAKRLHEEIGSADRLEEIARREGLRVESRLLFAGERLADLGASPDLITAASALDPGGLSAPVPVASGLALVAVDELLPPAERPLDEVREQVRKNVLQARREDAAVAKAEHEVGRNADFDALALSLGATVYAANDVNPGRPVRTLGLPTPEFGEALFGPGVAVGNRGVVRLPTGVAVYEVTTHQPYDPAGFETEKASVRRNLLVDKREQYKRAVVEQLLSEQTIEINWPLVQQFNG